LNSGSIDTAPKISSKNQKVQMLILKRNVVLAMNRTDRGAAAQQQVVELRG